eukprot:Pgem_evm1s14578
MASRSLFYFFGLLFFHSCLSIDDSLENYVPSDNVLVPLFMQRPVISKDDEYLCT